MQTTTQQGLTCYAISAAALMLLDPKTGGTLPDYWFNWQNGNTSRLTFIPDSWTQTDIVKWEQNTHGLGYNTALIVTEDEELAMLDLFDPMQPNASVSEDMGMVRLTIYPADAVHNTELLITLQQPDFPLALAFSALRGGGDRPKP